MMIGGGGHFNRIGIGVTMVAGRYVCDVCTCIGG